VSLDGRIIKVALFLRHGVVLWLHRLLKKDIELLLILACAQQNAHKNNRLSVTTRDLLCYGTCMLSMTAAYVVLCYWKLVLLSTTTHTILARKSISANITYGCIGTVWVGKHVVQHARQQALLRRIFTNRSHSSWNKSALYVQVLPTKP